MRLSLSTIGVSISSIWCAICDAVESQQQQLVCNFCAHIFLQSVNAKILSGVNFGKKVPSFTTITFPKDIEITTDKCHVDVK